MNVKICSRCREWRSIFEFNKDASRTDGLDACCKPCRVEKRKKTLEARKNLVYDLLGGECESCGMKDTRVLQVDHIDGGGAEERRTKNYMGILRKIIETEGEGYQLLCANCNWIKRVEQGEHK